MRQYQRADLHHMRRVGHGLHGLAVVEEPMAAGVHANLRIVRVVQVLFHVPHGLVFGHVVQLAVDAGKGRLVVLASGYLNGLAWASVKGGVFDGRHRTVGCFALVLAFALFVMDGVDPHAVALIRRDVQAQPNLAARRPLLMPAPVRLLVRHQSSVRVLVRGWLGHKGVRLDRFVLVDHLVVVLVLDLPGLKRLSG